MPPAVFVDLGFEAVRHPRRVAVVGGVADRAGRTRSAARAGVLAFPWLVGVVFTDPASVFAQGAFHRSTRRSGSVSCEEALQRFRHFAQLQIAPAPQLGRDIGGNVPRPALGAVESEDADRVLVLALEQVGDNGFEIGRLEVGFAPDPAQPAQIVHHQVDIMVIPAGDDRRGPVGSTQNKPPTRTGIQAVPS